MDGEGQYISVLEAAERLHLSDSRVRQLLREKKLSGVKYGRKWLITEKALAAFQVQPTDSRGDDREKAQHSLAQLAHFADVRRYIEWWEHELRFWNLENLWAALAKGTHVSFVTCVENEKCFPQIEGHLIKPVVPAALWDWWEELKQAATPSEESLENLWNVMSQEMREKTGLAVAPWEEPRTQEGATANFFIAILWEQAGLPALRGANYSSGSVTFEKNTQVWASVEEGIRHLRGEPLSSVGAVTVNVNGNGPLRIVPVSDKVRVVQKFATPMEGPPEVFFCLRYGLDLAFVRSPDHLPKVEQEHKRLREVYGPELAKLVPKEKQIIDLVSQFRGQLKKALQLWPHQWFPGHCPVCPTFGPAPAPG